MKIIRIIAALLFFGFQSGTGYSPPTLTTTTAGNWYAMTRAGDTGNTETQCYDASHAVFAANALTLTYNTASVSCGDYVHTATSHTANSAMVQLATTNFLFGDIQAKIKFTSGFPAFWLLGANCQPSNTVTPDNVTFGGKTCNWNIDTSDSGEVDIAEIKTAVAGTTGVLQNNCTNGGSCGFSFTATTTDVTANFHVYELKWISGSLTWFIDGTQTATTSSNVPQNPLFIIMNVAASASNGSPSNGQVMTVQWVKHCPSTCANNTTFVDANADFADNFTLITGPANVRSGNTVRK